MILLIWRFNAFFHASKFTGDKSEWGEHEIDYILFVQADVDHCLNTEEVQDAKYVTQKELDAMMDPSMGLLWSPWFRIIARKFLSQWWKNLDETLYSDKFVNHKEIYRFDPAPEYFGGAGDAREWLGSEESFAYAGKWKH